MSDSGVPSRWARQMACYLLLAGVFIYAVIERQRRPLMATGNQLPTLSLAAGQIQTRIDPNIATWAELARLPEVGESLARQIVAYREKRKAQLASGGAPATAVFQSVQDLDPIPGFGEKRLKRVEPFLCFPGREGPNSTE